MKVRLLAAGKRDKFCGIIDYSACLIKGLSAKTADAKLYDCQGWRFREIRKLSRDIKDVDSQIIHIQYPSAGMGNSPCVGLVPLMYRKSKVFLTLHEFHIFNFIRKLYMLPYTIWAAGIFFTNENERINFCKYYPWARKKSHIIPIGTNIIPPPNANPSDEGILYFGQIVAGKGLEEFLDTVVMLRDAGSTERCSIIGAVMDESLPIVDKMRTVAKTHNIDLLLNMAPADVSSSLLKHEIAILPFPDGVSDKRGSAMACLQHGLKVITVHGPATPDWLRKTTIPFTNPRDVAGLLQPSKRDSVKFKDIDTLASELDIRKWDNIAQRHLSYYEQALSVKG